jgi:hypothetical protein
MMSNANSNHGARRRRCWRRGDSTVWGMVLAVPRGAGAPLGAQRGGVYCPVPMPNIASADQSPLAGTV